MTELNSFLPDITLNPFPKIETKVTSTVDGYAYREALLECLACKASGNLYEVSDKTAIFDMLYCTGGQPPEVEHRTVFGNHTHEVACAGISIPHFHIACRCCGFRFFLSLPEKK